ncbi:hypothetical protein F4703DRAFT_1821264 [Phycomyces blakesleeanus]
MYENYDRFLCLHLHFFDSAYILPLDLAFLFSFTVLLDPPCYHMVQKPDQIEETNMQTECLPFSIYLSIYLAFISLFVFWV